MFTAGETARKMVTQNLDDFLHREDAVSSELRTSLDVSRGWRSSLITTEEPNKNGSYKDDVACLYNEGLHISVVLLGPAPEVEIVQQKVPMPHIHDGGFGNYHALAL